MSSSGMKSSIMIAGVIAVMSTSGCAYFSGVLPSAGIDPSIYYATSDVLVSKKLAVKVYPECVLDSNNTTQTCKGSMIDGRPILATGDQSDKSLPLTIKIGDTTIFKGSAKDVIAEGAQKQ